MSDINQRKKYLESLARKRIATGIFLFNQDKDILIVKQTFKNNWNVPGGCIEDNESITECLFREIKEEIGIDKNKIKDIKLKIIESKKEKIDDYIDESVQINFVGNMKNQHIDSIEIDNDEIIEYRFVSVDEAIKMLQPKMANRLKKIKEDNFENCLILENGKKVM